MVIHLELAANGSYVPADVTATTSSSASLNPKQSDFLVPAYSVCSRKQQRQQHPFNGLFSRTTCVSRYQKGKTSLNLNEARDNGVWDSSGISYTKYKQSAPCSRQIMTPTPHH